MQRRMTHADKKAWQEYQDTVKRIHASTGDLPQETEIERAARIKRLKEDPMAFCKYYFGRYMDAPFGWFHKKAIHGILDDPEVFALLEWAREHAKSVVDTVFIPLILYARGELSGMLLGSQTKDKAVMLLRSLQAEVDGNQRWLNDYGQLAQLGSWADGEFSTIDGIRFTAVGRGQSPRGTRESEKRPNYGVIDDVDEDKRVLNEQLVDEDVKWIMEAFYGALDLRASRLVISGNRIHRHSVIAKIAGDVEPGDPKREGLLHIKVYATEDPKTHKKLKIEAGGVPAWKERYTIELLQKRFKRIGSLSAGREYYHEHYVKGHVFRNEWMQWRRMLAISSYEAIVCYTDPSWKDTKKSDFKACVMVGFAKGRIDVLKVWLRQATTSAMVKTLYDWWEEIPEAQYWIEAGLSQDILVKPEFEKEGDLRKSYMPIRYDTASKPGKIPRIENMSPYFERGLVGFDEYQRKNPDFRRLIDQLKAFPTGHDDGPDALEGAITKGNRLSAKQKFKPRMGSYRMQSSRD